MCWAAGRACLQPSMLIGAPLEGARSSEHHHSLLRDLNVQVAASGSVLVSGGTGDIGRLASRWLAATHTSAHVCLLGRGGRSPQSAAAVSQHHRVTVAATNVASDSDLAGLVQRLASMGANAVTGVLHAGAVLHDTLLARQTAHCIRTVLAPKAQGALRLLHAATSMPLHAFVHFSSLTAFFGTPGQSNYAAANGALEGIALDCLTSGRPSSSILWGPWAFGMAVTDPKILQRFQLAGLGTIAGAPNCSLCRLCPPHICPTKWAAATYSRCRWSDMQVQLVCQYCNTCWEAYRGNPALWQPASIGRNCSMAPSASQLFLIT